MLFKKNVIASALAAAAVTGGMVGSASAVTISNTDVGQVLLGEMYIARATDYKSTRVTVINSSLTQAVKAKLVFRSKKHSDECKDVILYLTPGDVAYVDVILNSAGQPAIRSDDDSILSVRSSDVAQIRFASQVPLESPMVAPRTEPAADTCAQGHVEVIAAYAAQGTVSVSTGTPVTVVQGMSKFNLLRIFDTTKDQLNALNAGLCRVTNDGSAGCDGADFNSRVRLKGTMEIANGTVDRLLGDMVALFSGANANTGGVTTHNVTNTSFDVTVGAETLIGQGMGLPTDAGIVQSTSKLWDIEGALSTAQLFNGYTKGGTSFEVTFPTKYRHIATGRYSGTGATYTPPFFTRGEIQYAASLFDTQENSAPAQVTDVCIVSPCSVTVTPANFLIHEVNYEVLSGTSTWDPSMGWFRFSLTNLPGVDTVGTGQTWTAAMGAPSIGYGHYYQAGLTNSVVSRLGR